MRKCYLWPGFLHDIPTWAPFCCNLFPGRGDGGTAGHTPAGPRFCKGVVRIEGGRELLRVSGLRWVPRWPCIGYFQPPLLHPMDNRVSRMEPFLSNNPTLFKHLSSLLSTTIVALSRSLSLSLSLVDLSLSLSLALSLSLFLSPSLSLFLSFFHSRFRFLFLFLSISLSIYLSFFLSLSLSFSRSCSLFNISL